MSVEILVAFVTGVLVAVVFTRLDPIRDLRSFAEWFSAPPGQRPFVGVSEAEPRVADWVVDKYEQDDGGSVHSAHLKRFHLSGRVIGLITITHHDEMELRRITGETLLALNDK